MPRPVLPRLVAWVGAQAGFDTVLAAWVGAQAGFATVLAAWVGAQRGVANDPEISYTFHEIRQEIHRNTEI